MNSWTGGIWQADLRISQLGPTHPGGQWQVKPFDWSMQVPPWWQGLLSHSLTSTSHFSPEWTGKVVFKSSKKNSQELQLCLPSYSLSGLNVNAIIYHILAFITNNAIPTNRQLVCYSGWSWRQCSPRYPGWQAQETLSPELSQWPPFWQCIFRHGSL